MPAFPREEIEEMIRRFVEANDRAGRTGDWKPLAQFYTEDAV
jgi:ketosteroid isomerase-like protein